MSVSDSYPARVARTTHRISIRGICHVVHEWGSVDAPIMFFLHGWGDSGATFQFVVDELSMNWRVIAPDWRGFGQSNVRQVSGYWFPDYLADLHSMLRHFAPDSPARLVGHSMGGNIASLYAGIVPERVLALVNVEGFGLKDTEGSSAPDRYRQWFDAMDAEPRYSTYPDIGQLAARIRLKSPSMDENRARFVAEAWALDDGGTTRIRADTAHKLPNPVLYRRKEAEACWRRIVAPVLLVGGENSSFLKALEPMGDVLEAPTTSVVVPGADHMVHFEAPGRLAREIERFLSKHL